MDIIEQIKIKLKRVKNSYRPDGINAVVAHIEIAEIHYKRGLKEKYEHYFTDAVYRANHAFEGILKEAYEIIEEKDSSRATPYEIELYLTNNMPFNDRVMHLFSNYRTQWRNPSTHDYQLFFDGQEAFLAIVTVSSLVNVVLDQIIENLVFKEKNEKLNSHAKKNRANIEGYSSLPLIEKASEILKGYSEYFKENLKDLSDLSDPELLGSVTSYISLFDQEIEISTNRQVDTDDGVISPDIILSLEHEKLIVEVKRNLTRGYNLFFDSYSPSREQLKLYMNKSKIDKGIAFHTPAHKDDQIVISMMGNENETKEIYSVDPAILPEDFHELSEDDGSEDF